MNILEYILQNKTQIISLLIEHIRLTSISVGLAILIGVPLGILISYVKKLNKPILGAANIIQAIPSMALLGFSIPFLGIGTLPAVTTVILYSLLPSNFFCYCCWLNDHCCLYRCRWIRLPCILWNKNCE